MSVLFECPMAGNSAGAATVGEYMKTLLATVWREGECFSGKRPFGDSSWQFEVYEALVKAGIIEGTLDDEGYLDDCDTEEADCLIQEAIGWL